jgi:hypothetical protein
MRIIVLIYALAFLSCNQKQVPLNDNLKANSSNLRICDSVKKKQIKKISINTVYNESDYDFTNIQINYGTGNYTIDNDFNEFIIDSTLDKEVRYQTLKDYVLSQYADDRSIIRISNYVFSLQKNKGVLYIGLFRRIKNNNWKCVDVMGLEKYSKLGEYNYILGNNKEFSYACETSKGHFCYAIVIDKVNPAGKYDKILKAIKFDLVNEKIIDIDLSKERIECIPEMSDE